MNQDEVYRNFIAWLGRAWWGLPEAESLHPAIRARYTPQEAELLTGVPFGSLSLSELAEMKGMEPAELAPAMDAMAQRGLIWKSVKDGEPRYSLNDSFFVLLRSSFWAGLSDGAAKDLAPKVNKYFFDGFFDQHADVHIRGLRTLPIGRTIADTRQILPYEDVAAVMDEREYFSVSICPCKHRKNLDPGAPDCRHPAEVCLHFDRLGRYIDDHGMGRQISKQEAHEILALSADSGLVHGVSNWQQGVDTICNCCQCCCMWLESYHHMGHLGSLDASNYRVENTPEICKACGLCVDRCPMEALSLAEHPAADNKKGQAAVLKQELCIGCGVCAHKCPTGSLTLARKSKIAHPPSDPRDYMKQYFQQKKAAQQD